MPEAILSLLSRTGGVLRLRPEYVHRFYPDLNRLGQRRLKHHARQFIPERWIGSSVEAVNPAPIPRGGLSLVADSVRPLSLRGAICAAPEMMLGQALMAAHGTEFRVLVKVLDPGEPIVFHLHATDRQVRGMPGHFRGHRFGKDEAYYFLESLKGPMPYTHAGLHAGVTRRDLIDSVRRGPQYALELSPSFYQEYESGFFVPAGVPHRPGTALTLEIQQPSDVYTLLETRAAGKPMSAQQIHPGFRSLDAAFKLIDLNTSRDVATASRYRLRPQTHSKGRGGEVATIFPPEVCRRFAGRRIRVTRSLTYREDVPFVLWVWMGNGRINGRRARRGEEFFVTFDAAHRGVEIDNAGESMLEAFSFFPVV